jgi:hypothetical protein
MRELSGTPMTTLDGGWPDTTRRTTDPWLVSAVVVLALGLAVDLHLHSLAWRVGVLATLTVVAWVAGIALLDTSARPDRVLMICLPGFAALVMSVEGLTTITPWTVLVVLVLVSISPGCRTAALVGARWWWHELLPPAPESPSEQERAASRARHPSSRVALPGPESVAPPELPRAWADSYFALLTTISEPERRRIVELRGCYLDKLEQSDPDGFAAWLQTGPDPARAFHPNDS